MFVWSLSLYNIIEIKVSFFYAKSRTCSFIDIQFIFATHNANIPVLGDAERIFVVEYQDTTIDISQGNIDMKSTHKKIVDIMEGGEEAFDKRRLIYTSWK